MKNRVHKLARVRWHLGQALLPEHFAALESALSAEAGLRSGLSGLPDWGVGRLGWHEQLLRDGVLSITELTLVLDSGAVLDVPGNAVVSSFSLTATGTTRPQITLHVLDQHEPARNQPAYADDARSLGRTVRRLQLSTSDRLDGAVASFKLAVFRKGSTGAWDLDEAFVPPLLQVGRSPFLTAPLRRIGASLLALEPQLIAQLQDTFLRLERLAVVRATLATIYRVQSLLADLDRKVALHPYHIFVALRGLYFDLCGLHEVLPERGVIPYDHDDLGGASAALFGLLEKRLRLVGAAHNHLRFTHEGDLFRVGPLPEGVHEAQEIYLLIQNPGVTDRINIDDVRLASPARLDLTHRLVLRGVPFKRLERVHFQHSFGPEMDFYQITRGDEWSYALRESGLAFYQTAALKKANAFLFWR